jgi:ligand-binding sensor domain-containing protein/signal transduction histidine kinase
VVLAIMLCYWQGGLNRAIAAEEATLPEFLVRTWDNEDGLPSAPVRAVARTPDGYLWIGTDQGLARFDGVRFVTLTTNDTPALGDNRIISLFVDRERDLWAGTQGGTLARRHDSVFAPVLRDEKLRRIPINSLAQDSDGALWLATQGAGLVRHRKGKCDFFGTNNGLPSEAVSQVVADNAGVIWAVAGLKLVSFDGQRWQSAAEPPPSEVDVVRVTPRVEGGLWVATTFPQLLANRGGQVYRLQNRRWKGELTPYLWAQHTIFSRITALLEDHAGRLWTGTAGAGAFYWQEQPKWQKLASQGALAQLDCSCFTPDGEEGLWIGTTGGQLFQIRSRPVSTIHLPASGEKNVLLNACVRRDGSAWVGTDGAGLFRYQNGEFTRYSEEQGLADSHIGVILEDSHTNLWVGTWSGLFRLNGNRFEPVGGPPALREVVLALCEDHDGELWVGTGAGVVRMGPQGDEFFGRDKGVDHFYIRGIEEDAQGRIWLAIMDKGLYLLKDGQFARYGKAEWSGQSRIRALHADSAGALWIATFGSGLVRLKNGHFTQWSASDGLPSDMLVSITEDNSSNLWFSSENGIFGCPKSRLEDYRAGTTPRLLFWHLSVVEGLETKKCSGAGQPAVGHSSDGRLWIPDWRALAVFDPAEARRAWSLWPVQIEETLVDGKIQPTIPGNMLSIESSARSYEFHYTSPNLQTPRRVRFRYKLKGADPGWIEADQRRTAYYGHLPPGEYEFQVMAGGPAGVWQESARGLRLTVVPQFWERGTVRVAGAVSLLGAVAATVWSLERGRSRRRLQRAEAQEAMERERQRIARDLHDDLGSDLTEIMLLGEAAQASNSTERVRANASAIASRSRQAAAAMDEIIWTVNPRNDSVPRLADHVAALARRLFDPLPVQLSIEIMEDIPVLPLPATARHALFLAIKEAQNNVAKHSSATEIRVAVACKDGRLVVTVEDNGRGFDAVQSANIRNGLENMRQRMESIGGTFRLETQPGGGTRVQFEYTLPEEAAK